MRPYLILIATLLTISSILAGMGVQAAMMVEEGGFVETTTAVLYGMVFVWLLWKRPCINPNGNRLSAVVVLMLLFRELDFDKEFTTMGMFKSRFYISVEVSMMEKVIAALVTISIMVVVILLLRKYGRFIVQGVRRNESVAWGIVTAMLLAGVSKVLLDGLPRKLKKLDIEVPSLIEEGHSVVEETLELGIPIALLIAMFMKLKKRCNIEV